METPDHIILHEYDDGWVLTVTRIWGNCDHGGVKAPLVKAMKDAKDHYRQLEQETKDDEPTHKMKRLIELAQDHPLVLAATTPEWVKANVDGETSHAGAKLLRVVVLHENGPVAADLERYYKEAV